MEGKIIAKLKQNSTLNRRKIFSVGLALFLFSVGLALPGAAKAASLYFSPSSASYTVGQTFSLGVYVTSADQAMNAASGVISFPTDKLEITSLSKSGSIFSLWVQELSFSNSVGTINFEGIVLNPGFTGSAGKVITLNFKTKAVGSATVNFNSGSVLANDGKGTNILSSLGKATFNINVPVTGPTAPETTTPPETPGVPFAPVISSPTHPSPTDWYANRTAKFTWPVPESVTAVKLLYDKYPDSRPQVLYTPAIAEKEITDLEDGIYYFHAQFKNKYGWGAIAHFRFQIDTQPPEPFTIKNIDGKETENPRPTVLFDTTDALSGIDYYKIKIGEGSFFDVAGDIVKSNPYTLPPQAPGKRSIIVQAFDRAGNDTIATEEFTIKPLKAPVLTDYPTELQPGQVLMVKGSSQYPESQITLWLQKEKDEVKSQSVKTEKNGDFAFIWQEKLDHGIYKMWTELTDQRGAKSEPSQTLTFVVQPPPLIKIGSLAINYLSVIIPLIALVVLLGLLLWYSWYRFTKIKKKVKKEINEAEQALTRAFEVLKDHIEEQIKLLENTKSIRELTKEENRIIKQLKKDLDVAEKFVRKEIKDIEREIKK